MKENNIYINYIKIYKLEMNGIKLTYKRRSNPRSRNFVPSTATTFTDHTQSNNQMPQHSGIRFAANILTIFVKIQNQIGFYLTELRNEHSITQLMSWKMNEKRNNHTFLRSRSCNTTSNYKISYKHVFGMIPNVSKTQKLSSYNKLYM